MTGGEREVVKLSLGEGQPLLNVLPVGLEGDTMTLVCPFPVLPVEVPVNVTLPGQEHQAPVAAMIRRVGVELMGEAALPRFKLHLDLRSTMGQATIENPPDAVDERQIELEFDAADTSQSEDAIASKAETDESDLSDDRSSEISDESDLSDDRSSEISDESDLSDDRSSEISDESDLSDDRSSEIPEADMSWIAGESFGLSGEKAEDTWRDRGGNKVVDDDPPWAAEPDPYTVHAALDDSTRRKSRWPIRAAIALTLIISVVALGYEMREQIAPIASPIIGEELTLAALGMTPTAEVSADSSASQETMAEASEEAIDLPMPTAITDEPAVEAEETAEEEIEPIDDPSVEALNDQLRVVLPTRWPVTEARSYRLNEPTGIVVDVPGGMASERARWIETAHERVRSVRVLEREDGVRFIIYLNDTAVPRYRVGYSRAGVTVDIMGPDPRHMASK